MTIKEFILLTLKGLGMGAANVVPGVSGGTVAFITGIYQRLVGAINNCDVNALRMLFTARFKDLWRYIDGNFLLAVMAGVVIATFSLAKLMLVLLEGYAVQTWAFFFGLIVASSVLILRDIKGWKPGDAIFIAVGVALGVGVCLLSPVESPDGLWYIFICGAAAVCAMILPGLSGSFVLLVMGKYAYVMEAVSGVLKLDGHSILVLGVFALGGVCGLLAFAKLLHALLARWNRQTIVLLAGFVLGSLVKVWPWHGANDMPVLPSTYSALHIDPVLGVEAPAHIVAALLCAAAGVVLVLGLEWLGRRFGSSD